MSSLNNTSSGFRSLKKNKKKAISTLESSRLHRSDQKGKRYRRALFRHYKGKPHTCRSWVKWCLISRRCFSRRAKQFALYHPSVKKAFYRHKKRKSKEVKASFFSYNSSAISKRSSSHRSFGHILKGTRVLLIPASRIRGGGEGCCFCHWE